MRDLQLDQEARDSTTLSRVRRRVGSSKASR